MNHTIYQENILDHYKHPRNFGDLPVSPNRAHASNPLCGDELDFGLVFDQDQTISDVKFNGRGCTITVASASMLSEKIKGMKKDDIAKLSNDDILKLLGVTINPARMKCATLSLETVQKAIGHHS